MGEALYNAVMHSISNGLATVLGVIEKKGYEKYYH